MRKSTGCSDCVESKAKLAFSVGVLGDTGVGKTALVNQFVQQTFSEEHEPTIEDQHSKRIIVDEKFRMLEILDTAGDKQFAHLRELHYKTMEAFLIVFSVTSKASFIEAIKIYHQIYRARGYEPVPVIIFANKCDLIQQRQVSSEGAEEIIRRMAQPNLFYLEGSALNGFNVETAFYDIVRSIQQASLITQNKHRSKRLRASTSASDSCPVM